MPGDLVLTMIDHMEDGILDSQRAPFLYAILSDTSDHTSRLVYADWLEERGVNSRWLRRPRGRFKQDADGRIFWSTFDAFDPPHCLLYLGRLELPMFCENCNAANRTRIAVMTRTLDGTNNGRHWWLCSLCHTRPWWEYDRR